MTETNEQFAARLAGMTAPEVAKIVCALEETAFIFEGIIDQNKVAERTKIARDEFNSRVQVLQRVEKAA